MLRHFRTLAVMLLLLTSMPGAIAAPDGQMKVTERGGSTEVTVVFRKVEVAEVMEMLSRHARVNISLSADVEGEISVNLYDVSVDQAIRVIAESAGYAVEVRNNAYMVVKREDAGKYGAGGLTMVRSFGIRYADATSVSNIVKESLSHFGKVTVLAERGILVIQDLPDFIKRAAKLIRQLDREPTQVLIEAKILVVQLNDEYRHGIDWNHTFTKAGGSGEIGQAALAAGAGGGFFFDYATPHVTMVLDALEDEGRIRTISNPTLLALENQEAHVIIGNRLGYRVTTTINQVTTESVEFLESGTILRVTPSVDGSGNIRLKIRPQVSDGSLDSGLPVQNTTEVSTNLLLPDGETAFIGGLISSSLTESRTGVPYLMDVPGIRWLFGNKSQLNTHTETIVLITPRIVSTDELGDDAAEQRMRHTEEVMENESREIDLDMDVETEIEPKVDPLYGLPASKLPKPDAQLSANALAISPSSAPETQTVEGPAVPSLARTTALPARTATTAEPISTIQTALAGDVEAAPEPKPAPVAALPDTNSKPELETLFAQAETGPISPPAIEPSELESLPSTAASGVMGDGAKPPAWTVQLGVFSDPRNAEKLAARLGRQDLTAYTGNISSGGELMTGVFSGPHPTLESAKATRELIRQKFGVNGVVKQDP